MTNQISARYGEIELRSLYPTFALRGLILAASLHLAIIGTYYLATALKDDDPPAHTVRVTITDLQQPPSIKNILAPPAVTISAPGSHTQNAIPVAVPDATISPDVTIPDQDTIDHSTAAADPGIGEGGNVVVEVPKNVVVDAEPGPFTPVEKQPVPIINPSPQYPEIPLRAGIEGTVWLRVWVTKEGKTKKAEVVKTDSELFNQAAVEAAMKWVFTPAVMNNGPVAVWVTIPFKFKLQNRR